MDRRKIVFGLGAIMTPLALTWARGVEARDSTKESPGVGEVSSETLMTTPPLRDEIQRAVLSLSRITYGPGGTLEIRSPGPIALYIDSGALAIPFEPGQGLALLYSGSGAEPPGLSASADGMTVLPSGYAIFAEEGANFPTRNDGSKPLVVFAVNLASDNTSGESAGIEASAVEANS